MTKREYVINEGKKILHKSFCGGLPSDDQCDIEEVCISTIFNCMTIHKNICTDGVDDHSLRSMLNNLEKIFSHLFKKDIEKIDTTILIRIINHVSDIIDTVSTSMCITSTDKVTKYISYIIWMTMVLYSTKYDKDTTNTLSKCRVYLHGSQSKITIVVNDANVIPAIYSDITKYIMKDITELTFAIQEDDPIIKLYNSPDIVWYGYVENDVDPITDKWLDDELNNMNISRTELIEALKIKNDGLFSDIEGVSDSIRNFDISKFYPIYHKYIEGTKTKEWADRYIDAKIKTGKLMEMINYIKSDFVNLIDIYESVILAHRCSFVNISHMKLYLLKISPRIKAISDYGWCDMRSIIIRKVFNTITDTTTIIKNIKSIDDFITSINNIVWAQLVLYTVLKHNERWLACTLDTKFDFSTSSFGINIIIPNSEYYTEMHDIIEDIYPDILPEVTIKTESLVAQSSELTDNSDYTDSEDNTEIPKVTHLKYDNIRKSIEMGKFNTDESKEQLVRNAINSIKSPKLDTQIMFNLLKRREKNMSDIVTIHDILKKIKEKTEYITGKPLPNSITTTSDKSTDTTSVSITRFNSVMELIGSLNDGIYDDDQDKKYIIDMIYDTVLLILEHYKSKMNLKTVSRLYNTLCEIYDIFDKIITGGDASVLLDNVLWITYTAYCLSKDNPDESRKIRFDVDYDTEVLTIEVSDIDNIEYIQNIISRLDEYYMDIHYYINHDKTYFDKLCALNMNDFKPKKTIFCIVGESGSGKDTIVEYTLKEFKLQPKFVVLYIDREKQESETLLSDLAESDICIINPNKLNDLKNKYGDRFNFVVVYIDCPYTERRNRSENRSDFNSSFEMRALAEYGQFSEFRKSHGYDHVIDNGAMSTIYKSAMTLFDILRYYRKDIR